MKEVDPKVRRENQLRIVRVHGKWSLIDFATRKTLRLDLRRSEVVQLRKSLLARL